MSPHCPSLTGNKKGCLHKFPFPFSSLCAAVATFVCTSGVKDRAGLPQCRAENGALGLLQSQLLPLAGRTGLLWGALLAWTPHSSGRDVPCTGRGRRAGKGSSLHSWLLVCVCVPTVTWPAQTSSHPLQAALKLVWI